VAVVDLDKIAVAAEAARPDDLSGGRGAYRRAGPGAEVDAGMHGGTAKERVHPLAIATGCRDALDGTAHRQVAEMLPERVDLAHRARDSDDPALLIILLLAAAELHQGAADALGYVRGRKADRLGYFGQGLDPVMDALFEGGEHAVLVGGKPVHR